MNLQTKKKGRFQLYMLATFILGCALCACSGGGGSDDPQPTQKPTLSLNPRDFEFESTEHDSKNLEITTNGDWLVVYCPDWLSCSSRSGTGNATITLTTISENKDHERSDQIEIKTTKDGEDATQRVSVKQRSPYPVGCEVNINTATGQLIMSYGMACVVEFGNNTQYFYYKIYSDYDYSNIKGNDSKIIQDATNSGSGWKRENIPSSGGIEICYDQCLPKSRYVFVAVPFTSNGKNGKIYTNDFMTKPKEEEPLAIIKPNGQVATEVHDGDTGPWYKWEVKKESGTCSKYYTYVCASDTEFDMMKNHKGDFGQYDERDGVKVAWNIWLEHKGDQTTHTTTFNKGNPGGREKLFRSYSEGATQWLTAKSTDKYLQIVTWGVDENNNYSGIVYDVIYKVENGRLYPNPDSGDPDLILDASPTSLQFSAIGGADETKTISINSNTDWTVSSSKDWCEVDRTFGSNSGTITVHVKSNDTSNSRSALITITATSSGKYVEIQVSQDGKKIDTVIGRDEYDDDNDKNLDGGGTTTYTLSVTPTDIITSPAGEVKNVSVTSNDTWTVTSNQSWCTVSPLSGSNNGTIKVTTTKNTSSNSRSAIITIKGANSGSKTITVLQEAYTLSVTPSSLQMKSEGESKIVSVSSNDSWTVSSNQSWCTVSPSSGSNNGTITIKSAFNSSSSRTATVTIKGTNSGNSVTVSVSQEAGTVIGRDEYGNDIEIK